MKIEVGENDSEEFIDLINNAIAVIIYQWKVDEIMYIKIKNWFDHKWLNYSGKKVIHYEIAMHPDKVALSNDWKSKTTFPPFNPNRVLGEQYFRKRATNNSQFEKVVHKFQRSNKNQQNRVERRTENGLYVWYSSNSNVNEQGSLMVYRVDDEGVQSWYASFEKLTNWEIRKTKGIPVSELKLLIEK